MLTRSQARVQGIIVPEVSETIEAFEAESSTRKTIEKILPWRSYKILEDNAFLSLMTALSSIYRRACTSDGELVLRFYPEDDDTASQGVDVKLFRGRVSVTLQSLLETHDFGDLGIELDPSQVAQLEHITGTKAPNSFFPLCGVDEEFSQRPWYQDYSEFSSGTTVRESFFRDFVSEVLHAYRVKPVHQRWFEHPLFAAGVATMSTV